MLKSSQKYKNVTKKITVLTFLIQVIGAFKKFLASKILRRMLLCWCVISIYKNYIFSIYQCRMYYRYYLYWHRRLRACLFVWWAKWVQRDGVLVRSRRGLECNPSTVQRDADETSACRHLWQKCCMIWKQKKKNFVNIKYWGACYFNQINRAQWAKIPHPNSEIQCNYPIYYFNTSSFWA